MMDKANSNVEQRILEVAERLFLDKGFAKTSTVEIAREVGCNQALVHYYYRSKEKLFNAIFEKNARALFTAMLTTGVENISFIERVTHIIENHFDFLITHPRIPFLFFNEMLSNPSRLESFKNTMSELVGSLKSVIHVELQTEIQKGTVRPMTTIDLLLTILSLNVMLFLASPIIKSINGISNEEYKKLLERRKQENVLIVLRSLQP